MVFPRHVAVLAGLGSAVGNVGMEIAPVEGGALDRVFEFEVGAESMALAAERGDILAGGFSLPGRPHGF